MKKGRAAVKFAVRAVCCVCLSGDRRFYLLTFTRRAGDACKDLGSTLECSDKVGGIFSVRGCLSIHVRCCP